MAHAASLADTPPQAKFPHTGLQCLVAVARHHGVDLSVERLVHEHALAEAEPEVPRLLRIAQESGLQARSETSNWEKLQKEPVSSYPLVLRLNNGNYVLAVGFRGDTSEAVLADPLATKPGHLFIGREELERTWGGDILKLRRAWRLGDENQPFGLRWFVPELLRQKSLFRDVAIAALVLHVVALAFPIFFQLVIDRVLVHRVFSTLYVLTLGIVLALLFEAAFTFLRQYIILYATTRIDVRLAARVFSHLVSLPIAFFERNLAGVLLQHVQQQRRIREFLTGKLFITLLDATVLVIFIPVLLLYSVKLTIILLVFCAVIALVFWSLLGRFRERLLALYQAEAQRQGLLVETMHGMPAVKSLALEPRRRLDWEERVTHAAQMQFRVGQIAVIAQTGTAFLEKLMLVTIIFVGAHDVISGALTVGALVAFQMLSNRVSGPLVHLVALIHEFQETALAVRMLGEIMNRQPESDERSRGMRPAIRGGIQFENVGFSYTGTERVLNGVSFAIPPGAFVGVVGRSGSGKSTLARLIQGLYPVQEGTVRIDGVSVREIDTAHLRRSIGMVLQDTFLFRGTVRENIGVARADATIEEITHAAQMAGALEFIDRLPQGMQTTLEENAVNLSGGQKQRLAIARALLANPRILIFDEATSALDPESEAIVQQNLAAMGQGRTIILITHRLTNLVGAHAIVVIDRGHIVAAGRHSELIARPGLYRDLWQQQTKNVM
jgi:ATP-binding cassette subfamily B protein